MKRTNKTANEVNYLGYSMQNLIGFGRESDVMKVEALDE